MTGAFDLYFCMYLFIITCLIYLSLKLKKNDQASINSNRKFSKSLLTSPAGYDVDIKAHRYALTLLRFAFDIEDGSITFVMFGVEP